VVGVIREQAVREGGEDVAAAHRVHARPPLPGRRRQREAAAAVRWWVLGEHVPDADAVEVEEQRLLPAEVAVAAVQVQRLDRRERERRRHQSEDLLAIGQRRSEQRRCYQYWIGNLVSPEDMMRLFSLRYSTFVGN
jgi:hypothetical protein